MKIESLSLHPYELALLPSGKRAGALVHIQDDAGGSAWGDMAPLPGWSQETLHAALEQCSQRWSDILKVNWTARSCLEELKKLELWPSVSFGIESALFSLLSPLEGYTVPVSALLMGSVQQILSQAALRYTERYTSAKLKVGHLSFEEAAYVISELKDKFRLRIDVNRAWETADSLAFFAQFPFDAFDYVEEPFRRPEDLSRFPHPLAVDESFPTDLCLKDLESLPTLKALIYKPTLQGGLRHCLPLHEWALKRGVALVLSSSFESDLGLGQIASIARRLSLSAPLGIGTYHYLQEYLWGSNLRFVGPTAHISASIMCFQELEKRLPKMPWKCSP